MSLKTPPTFLAASATERPLVSRKATEDATQQPRVDTCRRSE